MRIAFRAIFLGGTTMSMIKLDFQLVNRNGLWMVVMNSETFSAMKRRESQLMQDFGDAVKLLRDWIETESRNILWETAREDLEHGKKKAAASAGDRYNRL